jgi:hypothetical protein
MFICHYYNMLGADLKRDLWKYGLYNRYHTKADRPFYERRAHLSDNL